MRQRQRRKGKQEELRSTEHHILALAIEALSENKKQKQATRLLADKLRRGYPTMVNTAHVARAAMSRLLRTRKRDQEHMNEMMLAHPLPELRKPLVGPALAAVQLRLLEEDPPLPIKFRERIKRRRPCSRHARIEVEEIADSIEQLKVHCGTLVHCLDEAGAFEALMAVAQIGIGGTIMTPEIFTRHVFRPERN